MEWQEVLFAIINIYVLPFWFIMIVLPNKSFTKGAMQSLWIFAPLLVIYAALIIPGFAGVLADVANPQLSVIQELLGSPEGTLLAWTHLLAFDLFVGRWIYMDNQKKQGNSVLTGIALFFTLMSGPFGLLLYMIFGFASRKGKK